MDEHLDLLTDLLAQLFLGEIEEDEFDEKIGKIPNAKKTMSKALEIMLNGGTATS